MVVGPSPADLSGLGKADRVAELRRRLASMPGGGPPAAARAEAPVEPRAQAEAPVIEADPAAAPDAAAPGAAGPGAVVPGVAVPDSVAPLLPGGVLPAGRVTAVAGSAALRVGLLAAATASGARCAVVGWPELGVAAVAEQGGRLDCLALVPDPGPDPASVVSVLLDGLDLVLVGPDVAVVAPTRARVLAGRVRAAGAGGGPTAGGAPRPGPGGWPGGCAPRGRCCSGGRTGPGRGSRWRAGTAVTGAWGPGPGDCPRCRHWCDAPGGRSRRCAPRNGW